MRAHLIRNGIYCPIHWAIPDEVRLNTETKKLYDEELSLVCDQRYCLGDMDRTLTTIEAFFRK